MLLAAQDNKPQYKIHVWIDFVCPYCLLWESILRQAIEGLNVSIEWLPTELRPYPQPTLRPEDDYLPAAWKSGVYPAAKRMGIEIKLPTVSPQPYTRLAFLGLMYAQDRGRADAYVDATLKAFFQRDLDVGCVDVLEGIFDEIGLSASFFSSIARSEGYNAKYDELLAYSQRLGVRAVPSTGIGTAIIPGMISAPELREMIIRFGQIYA